MLRGTQIDRNDTIKGRRPIYSADRKNKSIRAMSDKLTVEKGFCEFCGHDKKFVGNIGGNYIIKCCKCKHITRG